ncbi:MAG: helix-turn-helix domain-containing protein [Clostridiales Family XIII bacterium]|jgi:transcriptional regulator with XRE-family HTH domain|nr:helix-turn-helix domain-containing protein [Clostridiales Family XIII bacterium]
MQNTDLNNNILSLFDNSPGEIVRDVAARVRRRRLELDLTQQALAVRAGMPVSTYRRFEQTGEIAFASLVGVAAALDQTDGFAALFSQRKYRNLDEVKEQKKINGRKRGRIKE